MAHIEVGFPGLRPLGWNLTSLATKRYNCIAWAAGDDEKRWWPDMDGYYWPDGVRDDNSVASFVAMFEDKGYELCDTHHPEAGFEKVAVFAVGGPGGEPKHAARQQPNGRWTSKLGVSEDIEHDLLELQGAQYGVVAVILRRPLEHDVDEGEADEPEDGPNPASSVTGESSQPPAH